MSQYDIDLLLDHLNERLREMKDLKNQLRAAKGTITKLRKQIEEN